MADPSVQTLTKDVWTKVATNVVSGYVHILKKSVQYLQTYRDNGGAVPAAGDPSEGAELNFPGTPIEASAGIDVYIMPLRADGRVRVDV